MKQFICVTCGTQYLEREQPPEHCPICQDERQFLRPEGQSWTDLDAMRSQGYRNTVTEVEPGLFSLRTEPSFGIGQRALLVATPSGNVLWDCISYLDEATVEWVNERGGIQAIAISHPHYYSTVGEWADQFRAPIYLHAADRQWVMRPHERIHHWEGDTLPLLPGITVLRLGGHFPGSSVLHWQDGAGGQGALLTGDTIQVAEDNRWVSFMYSYPNMVPLPVAEVERVVQRLGNIQFERLYGFKPERVVARDARGAVLRSRDRYLRALLGAYHSET